MRIYRVEHPKTRKGPWQHQHRIDHMPRFFPLPALVISESEKCACRSIIQLVKWFGGYDRKRLHKLGYVLRVYEVSEVTRQDGYQVAIRIRPYQRAIATHSLLDVMNG